MSPPTPHPIFCLFIAIEAKLFLHILSSLSSSLLTQSTPSQGPVVLWLQFPFLGITGFLDSWNLCCLIFAEKDRGDSLLKNPPQVPTHLFFPSVNGVTISGIFFSVLYWSLERTKIAESWTSLRIFGGFLSFTCSEEKAEIEKCWGVVSVSALTMITRSCFQWSQSNFLCQHPFHNGLKVCLWNFFDKDAILIFLASVIELNCGINLILGKVAWSNNSFLCVFFFRLLNL